MVAPIKMPITRMIVAWIAPPDRDKEDLSEKDALPGRGQGKELVQKSQNLVEHQERPAVERGREHGHDKNAWHNEIEVVSRKRDRQGKADKDQPRRRHRKHRHDRDRASQPLDHVARDVLFYPVHFRLRSIVLNCW